MTMCNEYVTTNESLCSTPTLVVCAYYIFEPHPHLQCKHIGTHHPVGSPLGHYHSVLDVTEVME
jgi:hypothetical protein